MECKGENIERTLMIPVQNPLDKVETRTSVWKKQKKNQTDPCLVLIRYTLSLIPATYLWIQRTGSRFEAE
jgi:hypothetical protein